MRLYAKRPIIDNRGGMNSAHLFWLYYVLKKMNPKYIVESGVFKGQGTWFMRNICPHAKIFSIDPNLKIIEYKDNDNDTVYFDADFTKIDWNQYLVPEETLCFFDDHQDAYARLQQMKWMGFKYAMFEDNYPVSQGDCYSLKKVFAKCGFVDMGETKIEPNIVDMQYVIKNIKTYTTFPPLFRNKQTRWGDEWDDVNYPTPSAIFEDDDSEKYQILKEEAFGYTWMCFVELN